MKKNIKFILLFVFALLLIPSNSYAAAGCQGVYETSVEKKATLTEDGTASIFELLYCGDDDTTPSSKNFVSKQTIYHPAKYVLSKTVYNYNGDVKRPSVKIYTSNNELLKYTNYRVSYSNILSKKVGAYSITIDYIGSYYEGRKVLTYRIIPNTVKLKSVQSLKKSFKAIWIKNTTQTTGYQLIYSTDKNFKRNYKKVNIKSNKTLTKTIKNLKSKKTYYVSVRTYKTINGLHYFSKWSNIVKVKTK